MINVREELKKPLVAAVVVLAIISLIVISWTYLDDNYTAGDTPDNSVAYNTYTQEGLDETPAEPAAEEAGQPAPGVQTKRLTYTEALKIYGSATGNGYHYQFTKCLGTPGKLTMKKGTKFLLDNRDNALHTFKVGTQTFNLGRYGFAVVTAKDLGTYNILCDGAGSASIQVQP